jgi:AraC family transcriptional regulator
MDACPVRILQGILGEARAMKYQQAGLLSASTGRGWVGITAEVRTHAAGLILENKTSTDMELAIAVGGPTDAVIHCISGKRESRCLAVAGTVWTCPAGTREDFVESSALTPSFLHVFMPARAFESLAEDRRRGVDALAFVRYKCGFIEPLIAACGLAIAQELAQETSAGPMLVEAIGNTIAARLIHANTGRVVEDTATAARSGLDSRRLVRVLEAIDAGLEDNLSLAYLASVACLSQFHFARAFKASMGVSPHQHVSRRRLERAKELIMAAAMPMSQIAASLGFSSQANFNRAFKAATGMAPLAYRLARVS